MRLFRDTPDERLIEVCEEFLADRSHAAAGEELPGQTGKATFRSTLEISKELTRRWTSAGIDFRITREEIYFVLAEARRRGLFSVVPRANEELRRQLCASYRVPADRIRVVATESHLPDHVARHAAELIVKQIFELWQRLRERGKDRVHVGFGAGWTTRVVAYQLARLLQEQGEIPPLAFHAIACGYQARTAPVMYFGFFENLRSRVELIGMFGPPYARYSQYETVCSQPGLREAFEQKHEIDLVMTSLASFDDPHGGLWKHMSEGLTPDMLELLKQNDWRGDLHLCPFNADGPIEKKEGNRAVTLFDLPDLVAMAQNPDQRVVIVAPPCGECGLTRAPALAPLLTSPRLRAWSHIVTDIPTARELLDLATNPLAPRTRSSSYPDSEAGSASARD